MAKTKQFKLDPTRPFYAVVGAGDLAVEYARTAATDVQARFSKVDLEPKALGDQARTVVASRIDELAEDAKKAQSKLGARVADLQTETLALPGKVEAYVNETAATATGAYGELAVRGQVLVNRIRKQQATQDAKAAAGTTAAKARTTRTQATRSATKTAGATKTAAKKNTAAAKENTAPAQSSAKATGTSAKKTASTTGQAASAAARKVGN